MPIRRGRAHASFTAGVGALVNGEGVQDGKELHQDGRELHRPRARASTYERLFKPAFDVVASFLLMVVLSPLLMAVAIAIKLDSPGPVLFVQTRIGQHGRRIRVIRFRAVDVSSELWQLTLAHAPVEIELDSPGLTGMGRVLLRTKLDRLPQLFNVLRREMSLVGPRPPLPYEISQYRPWDWIRLRVKPGLTCLWQLDREEGTQEAAMSRDHRYVVEISFQLDLTILFFTAVALISGRVPR
jgi:lipopolysaccharide/colanic/teichoic acid biosynthesis glycosyltransferase